MAEYWTTFLDLLYPPKCPACKGAVHEQGAWCPSCLLEILAPRQLELRGKDFRALDSCQVICYYTGFLKRLIHDMKFRRQEKDGIYLRWLLEELFKAEIFPPSAMVIPVPLHKKRLQERGYNQTEVIFKKWALKNQFQWKSGLLFRIRPTIPQWELSLQERRKNIKNAFAVNQAINIKDQSIILVDDILTTGITLEEGAAVLKKAGAKSVHGLVIASGAQ